MSDDETYDHVSEHPPERDIDQFIEQIDKFRIERMGSDGVWINVFDANNDIDVHFDINCSDDGLHITRRDEHEFNIED